jgi:hypothetical protein
MPLQVRIEEGPRSQAVRVGGLQYCQYSQEKISLITLLLDHVYDADHVFAIFKMLLHKLIGSTAFGLFQQDKNDFFRVPTLTTARIIPRTILITKSSSKTSFWVQDHSFATHRMFSKLSCSTTL